jgi:ribosomal protein S27AE
MNKCAYCNGKAFFQLSNGKWCCKETYMQCPSIIEKNIIGQYARWYKINPDKYKIKPKVCKFCGSKNVVKQNKDGSWMCSPHPNQCPVRAKDISKKKTGKKRKPFSKEWRKRLGKASKKAWADPNSKLNSEEYRNNLSIKHTGREITWKDKISKNHADVSGKNNPMYGKRREKNPRGTYDPEKYDIWTSPEYQEWRNTIFKRDHYTCKMCGDKKSKRGYNAHHIFRQHDYPKLRYKKWNGITLCVDCHLSIFNKEKEYIPQFLSYTIKKSR